ncbi:SH3 domain-containing protein [Mesorhizobium sp. B2-3-5]|nr:SH3 domain-containing protein [Mesorhizobium sp. B2-3-5]
MKRHSKTVAAAVVAGLTTCLIAIGPTAAAAAMSGVVVGQVNMRAGPGTKYPVVVTLPARAGLTVYGCTANVTWCDVSRGRDRGWIAASYVSVSYGGNAVVVTPAVAPVVGLTVVSFNRAYWDSYYAGRAWYGQWTAYAGPYGPAPYGRAVTGCVDGACGGAVAGPGRAAAGFCADGTCRGAAVNRAPYGGVWLRRGSISLH